VNKRKNHIFKKKEKPLLVWDIDPFLSICDFYGQPRLIKTRIENVLRLLKIRIESRNSFCQLVRFHHQMSSLFGRFFMKPSVFGRIPNWLNRRAQEILVLFPTSRTGWRRLKLSRLLSWRTNCMAAEWRIRFAMSGIANNRFRNILKIVFFF